MNRRRFGLVIVLSLVWLGMLAGGDCDINVNLDRWTHFYDDGFYYDEVIYDPYYPCCF